MGDGSPRVTRRRLFELVVVYPSLTAAFFLIVLVAATPRW
jgi:hypothetical protein